MPHSYIVTTSLHRLPPTPCTQQGLLHPKLFETGRGPEPKAPDYYVLGDCDLSEQESKE